MYGHVSSVLTGEDRSPIEDLNQRICVQVPNSFADEGVTVTPVARLGLQQSCERTSDMNQ